MEILGGLLIGCVIGYLLGWQCALREAQKRMLKLWKTLESRGVITIDKAKLESAKSEIVQEVMS